MDNDGQRHVTMERIHEMIFTTFNDIHFDKGSKRGGFGIWGGCYLSQQDPRRRGIRRSCVASSTDELSDWPITEHSLIPHRTFSYRLNSRLPHLCVKPVSVSARPVRVRVPRGRNGSGHTGLNRQKSGTWGIHYSTTLQLQVACTGLSEPQNSASRTTKRRDITRRGNHSINVYCILQEGKVCQLAQRGLRWGMSGMWEPVGCRGMLLIAADERWMQGLDQLK
ncbi:hypothetical protein CH063_13492, partial [Colletotrichum higginsianum]